MAQLRNFLVVLALLICAEAGTEENNDAGDGSSDYITVKVRHASDEIYFRVKMSTQMGKLRKTYSQRAGIPESSIKFLFDGSRINDDETLEQLEMKNDDAIDVLEDRSGGDSESK